MLPQNKPDRIRILFDDHRLVANADAPAGHPGPAPGLRELVDHHLDLGSAPGRANTGDKMLTLVASALAGGECIDDADALRAGGTVGCSRLRGQGAIHPGDLRAASGGGMSVNSPREPPVAARAWAWGRTRRLAPDLDLDSTICETYGLAKEGARHHGYTGARGYHPLGPLPPAPARC